MALTRETRLLAKQSNKVLHDKILAIETRLLEKIAKTQNEAIQLVPTLIPTSLKSAACTFIPPVIYDHIPQSILVIVDTGISTHTVPIPVGYSNHLQAIEDEQLIIVILLINMDFLSFCVHHNEDCILFCIVFT